jgi:D-alanyl-D-alanine carboxypeptidase
MMEASFMTFHHFSRRCSGSAIGAGDGLIEQGWSVLACLIPWLCLAPAAVLAADLALAGQPNSGPPERVSDSLCDDMKLHKVLRSDSRIGCDRLRLVRFAYVGFDTKLHDDGQVVVLDAVARHVTRIFAALRERGFPIAQARLMNQFDADDDASMADNNTSGFNDRNIADGSRVSLHALGLAIDVNPVQNPVVTRSGNLLKFLPAIGATYANRLNIRPGKPVRPGMAEAIVQVFAEEGFLIWGGYWDEPIDYQHFEVGRRLAERLVSATPSDAETIFESVIQRYRKCRTEAKSGEAKSGDEAGRVNCINTLDVGAIPRRFEEARVNKG